MTDEDLLRNLLTDEQPARPEFKAQLRADLVDEWHDGVATRSRTSPPVRPVLWAIAAAATVALLVGGLVWISRSHRSGPTIDTTPTGPSTTVATTAAAVTQACHRGTTTSDELVTAFVADLVAARSATLSSVPECVVQIPAGFTGAAPYCWDECAPRQFDTAHVDITEVSGDSGSFWLVELPVSYRVPDRQIDATEYWRVQRDGASWAVSFDAIRQPDVDRQRAVEIINRYLAAIASADWPAAAGMLDECGTVLNGGVCSVTWTLDDRSDLRRIGVDEQSEAAIAAALQGWCASGCDTSPVTDADLSFAYGYGVTRTGQTIMLHTPSTDGAYFLSGAPFRTAPMTRVLATWASPTMPDPGASDTFAHLLPVGGFEGASVSASSEELGDDGRLRFEQWFVDPSALRMLSIVTTDNVTPEGDKREVFLPGWDRAYVWDGVDGAEPLSVRLVAGDRVVIVEGHGYSADELVGIAGGITPRSTGTAGWDVTGLPASTVLYGEGWSSEAGHTAMTWTEGQRPLGRLTVDTRSPHLAIGGVWSIADVNGTMAIAGQEPGGHSTVYWQPSPGVYAAFDMIGTIEETVQTAQQFHEASGDAWRQYAAEHALR